MPLADDSILSSSVGGVLNRDEFTALALRQMPELTAFTRRLARSVADAHDLLQSTYAEAFRSWKALRDPGACRAWLFRIARNCWIGRYRASLARPELHAVDSEELEWLPPDTAFVESVERVDLERALKHSIARLPARDEATAASQAKVDRMARSTRRSVHRLAAVAMIAFVVVCAGYFVRLANIRAATATSLVADHHRSNPSSTPPQVVSSDPETIARFFDGRTGFEPRVPEFSP